MKISEAELKEIFDNAELAIQTMKRVFNEHEQIETVIVNPDSWVGKELLNLSKRVIDMGSIVARLESKVDQLLSYAKN